LNNGTFCYCLASIELVPLSEPWNGYTGIVPVVYCVSSVDFDIARYMDLLNRIENFRFDYMRSYWCGHEGNRYDYGISKICKLMKPESMMHTRPVPLDWQYDGWFGIDFVSIFPDPRIISLLILSLVRDQKIIVISSSQSRRASGVMALVGLFESCLCIAYPHPCLTSAPVSIASELPHAPTPLIA
jgi:hypothetical protein